MSTYHDFELQVFFSGTRLAVRAVAPGLERDCEHVCRRPFPPKEIEALARRALLTGRGGEVLGNPISETELREAGQRLYAAVFGGKVFAAWQPRLARAKSGGMKLRLWLRLEDPELARWPWELLCEPGEEFLAFSPHVAIARQVPGLAPTPAPLLSSPVRIVVAQANPTGTQPLDCAHEREFLESALRELVEKRRVEVEVLEAVRLPDIAAASGRRVDVFHFIGHGAFDELQGEGRLKLVGESGSSEPVTGWDLARALGRVGGCRLVVLNTCEGAKGGLDERFSDVAQRVCREVASTVIAMRYPISDPAAVAFTRHFYSGLASGLAVEDALRQARLGMSHERFVTQWASPVLFQRRPAANRPPWKRRLSGALALAAVLVAGWQFRATLEERGFRALRHLESPPRLAAPAPPPPVLSDLTCPSPRGLDLRFVPLPGGLFAMGPDEDDPSRRPPHPVRISRPFCFGQLEVTQKQWRAVMGSNPSKYKGDSLPVTNVSWNDAQLFLAKLNELDPEGRYRLATEAEWEYAARLGTSWYYGFGDDPALLPWYGNFDGPRDGYLHVAPADAFPPNPWGIYGLHGNVSEWVEDRYGPYPTALVVDSHGPREGTDRVRRGGSLRTTALHCSAVARNHTQPGRRLYDVGFRIVREPRGSS
jgi:hypothetical protein